MNNSSKTIFFKKFEAYDDPASGGKPLLINLARVCAIQPHPSRDGLCIFYFGSEGESEGTYVFANFDDICKYMEMMA